METRSGTEQGAKYDGAAASPPPEQASLFEDFIDIFYAPSTVFARREKSGFWLHLLVVAVIAGLFAYASRGVMEQIFDAEFQRGAADAMARNPQLTQEAMDTQRNIMARVTMFMAYIGTPIAIFVIALVSWIAARVFSAKISYQQAVMIVTLAWIPRLVQSVITTLQSLVMDTGTVTSMHSLGFSPARFMDPDSTSRQVMALAGRFDLFTLWVTVLIGIGIAVMAKVPRGKGLAAAAVVFVLGTLPLLIGG